jgi:Na+-transporting methylmalonyl-CoA/oxaloacetate decarboxylase gamma subunit
MAFVFVVLFALIAFFDRPIPRLAKAPVAGQDPVREA